MKIIAASPSGLKMSDVAQTTQQEFWRPPTHHLSEEVAVRESHPAMAEVCARCGTEFLVGSRFCFSCGGRRREAISSSTRGDASALAGLWERGVRGLQSALRGFSWSWLRYLHFHEIKTRIGLSTGSLIAFVIGLACVAGALLAGLLTAKTWNDFQAIQFYRAEWLLGATAAFVAGILLKKSPSN